MRGGNLKKISLFISCFLLTLPTLGIIGIILSFSFLLITFFLYKTPLRKNTILELLVLLFCISIAALRFNIFIINESFSIFSDSFFNNFLSYVSLIAIWFLLRQILQIRDIKETMLNILYAILILNLSFFFVQFITFLFSGYYLDFAEFVTGKPSRYLSFDNSLMGIGSFRPTGLYFEPSNYFYVIFVLFSIIYMHDRKRIGVLVTILTILSMFISFSTTAVIITLLLIVLLALINKTNFKVYFIAAAFIIPLLVVFSTNIMNLKESQENKFERSAGIRTNLILYALNNQERPILGYGIFSLPPKIYKSTTSDIGDKSMASINDSGVLVYLWVRLGYSGIALFLIMGYLVYRKRGLEGLMFFLLLSLTKINPFGAVFLLFLATIISFNKPVLKRHLFIQQKLIK